MLFVNPRSGDGAAARARLVERARALGIEAVVLAQGENLAALAEAAVMNGADALGVAGGDGSLAIVAAQAVARRLPFVCIPAGTRNHFALDVGVDRHDLVGALEAFADGVERRIDRLVSRARGQAAGGAAATSGRLVSWRGDVRGDRLGRSQAGDSSSPMAGRGT